MKAVLALVAVLLLAAEGRAAPMDEIKPLAGQWDARHDCGKEDGFPVP